MADIFDLAPEGQAWTDNLSKDKAAKPDDYDPSFFAGSLSAFPRGAAEGAIGLAQTLTAAGKEVVSDQQTMLEWAPTYGIFKSMFPGADDALNSAYDSTAKSLETARQYVKPDATTQGMSAQVLNEFGKFVPAIGATVTIFNQTSTDTPVINWQSSLRFSGWTMPVSGKHRSMSFVYDAAFAYYTAKSVGQFDISN